jgi:adenylosuccinate synthase
VKPIYKTVQGWKSDIQKCKKFEEFPEKFIDYIKLIEDNVCVPIKIISDGARPEEIIFH